MTTIATRKSTRLKEIFNRKGNPVVHVTAPTPLGAKLLEKAGYEYVFIGGNTTLGTMYGKPGIQVGLLEKLRIAKLFARAVDVPVMIDADELCTSSLDFIKRAIPRYIKAGIAGIDIDDRLVKSRRSASAETRGGYTREAAITDVISKEAMVEKIRAIVEAKQGLDPDFIIRARCYVLVAGKGGLPELIDRFKAYRDAGADVLYFRPSIDKEQLRQIVDAVKAPVTTTSSWMSPQEAAEVGLCEVRYPEELERAMNLEGWRHIVAIREKGIAALQEFRERFKDSPYTR